MFDQRGQGISVLLRERGKAAWAAATRHPMVAEIGAGTLPHQRFPGYFEQNILYLQDYARAIALIAGKAPDLAAIGVLRDPARGQRGVPPGARPDGDA